MVWLLGLALAQSGAEAPAAEPVSTEEAVETGVWVASIGFPGPRLDRVVRQAERMGAEVEPVAAGIRCLRFPSAPDPEWVERSGRRLGIPLEPRANCSVARYPAGEGWWLAVMAPDRELEERIEASLGPLGMSVLAQPLDGRPASLCVSSLQVTRSLLVERLQLGGIDVQGVFSVGSCTSRVHRLPLGR
jgi:hypothetical protein